MWPMLLNMTRDECRRTLRRLELEAYSNMISVFRAQGALEENRKKLLEELRAVLHISSDRHSAEARRVSNDELLATIAEQLAGPNTGLAWISEGRRRVPLMPRGIAQTMFTEIADKAAEAVALENNEIRKRIETEKLIAPKTNEEEKSDHEGETAEGTQQLNNEVPDDLYPPIAMEDHSAKIWETELICRKRKLPEGGGIPEAPTPIKNMRNVPVNTNQKHLNLSKVYSRYSQPSASKSLDHSKHSYNQVSKVSTSKTGQQHARSVQHKPRAHRQSKQGKAQKKAQESSLSPGKQYNQSLQMELTGTPGSFQASYAQSIMGGKTKADYIDDIKPGVEPSPVPQELKTPNTPPVATHHARPAPPSDHPLNTKPCQLLIKKRTEITADKKVQTPDVKTPEEVKFVSLMGRQMVTAASASPKPLGANRLVTTKVISSLPKTRPSAPIIHSDKMIVVPKSSIPNSKIIITSSALVTSSATFRENLHTSTNSISNKTSETLTPKGIPATDLKVSAKTFVLNPKSGQKMVVVPAKTNKDVQLPLFHFKGIQSAMKLVSVSSSIAAPTTKASTVTVMSKPSVVSALPSNAKIIGVEPIKTANMADIVPVKGLVSPITSTKVASPIVRPVNTKGNVIVVQKGNVGTLGKALTFTKNGNDVSKIIMGKNVNKLLQTSKPDQVDPSKGGNVIVLELNNEQTGRATTMSEILGSRKTSMSIPVKEETILEPEITQDTPVLFENQMTSDMCNTSSLDSTTSLQEMERLEEAAMSMIDKAEKEKSDGGKDSSSVTDWEMELDTVSGKSKDDVDKLNSLHLDLGMSSDSENEFMAEGRKSKSQHLTVDRTQTDTPTGEGNDRCPASALSRTTRTLLSQLQDESSSNDSSFAIKPKITLKDDKSESEALSKARAKLCEKVAEARSQQKRIDVYSTAISAEINLDSFSYLDESLMVDDRLLADDHPTDNLPLHKNDQ